MVEGVAMAVERAAEGAKVLVVVATGLEEEVRVPVGAARVSMGVARVMVGVARVLVVVAMGLEEEVRALVGVAMGTVVAARASAGVAMGVVWVEMASAGEARVSVGVARAKEGAAMGLVEAAMGLVGAVRELVGAARAEVSKAEADMEVGMVGMVAVVAVLAVGVVERVETGKEQANSTHPRREDCAHQISSNKSRKTAPRTGKSSRRSRPWPLSDEVRPARPERLDCRFLFLARCRTLEPTMGQTGRLPPRASIRPPPSALP